MIQVVYLGIMTDSAVLNIDWQETKHVRLFILYEYELPLILFPYRAEKIIFVRLMTA